MGWPDCIVDRHLSKEEITSALSKYLSIPSEGIMVVEEVPGESIDVRVQLLCERTLIKGDFHLKLSFYPQNPALEQGNGDRFIDYLCETLHCKCLISDDSFDPYSMILVEAPSRHRQVFLDPDCLDQEPEEYIVKHVRQP